MATTSIYGIPYQGLLDQPHGPHLGENLAKAVEAQVLRLDNRTNAFEGRVALLEGFADATEDEWQAFTPIVYTTVNAAPTAISATVEYARFKRVGKTVWANASTVTNAVTTGGCGIMLPVPAKQRFYDIGNCRIMGTGAPTDQSGVAYMAGDGGLNKLVVVRDTQGFLDLSATGMRLRYSVCYETA